MALFADNSGTYAVNDPACHRVSYSDRSVGPDPCSLNSSNTGSYSLTNTRPYSDTNNVSNPYSDAVSESCSDTLIKRHCYGGYAITIASFSVSSNSRAHSFADTSSDANKNAVTDTGSRRHSYLAPVPPSTAPTASAWDFNFGEGSSLYPTTWLNNSNCDP